MTGDEITVRDAALFAYRNHYDALAESLDLGDDEMLRIFGHLDYEMNRDGVSDLPQV
jgi:hypothetical protein